MDPWLQGRIRLAERRGLLSRGSLNEVQEVVLELSILLGEERRRIDFSNQVKLALLGANPDRFAKPLFPDWFHEGGEDDLDEALDNEEGVEIEMATTYNPEDAERLMGQLIKSAQGSFGLGEVEDDDDGEDWGFGYGQVPEGATEDDLLELPEGMSDVPD